MKEFLSKFIIYILHNDIIRGEMPWKRFHIFQIAPAVTKTIMSMSSKKAWLNWLQVQYDYSYWRRSDNLDWLQSIFSLEKSETRWLTLSIVRILHRPFFSSNVIQYVIFDQLQMEATSSFQIIGWKNFKTAIII